jgi:hypothetical protein
MWSSNYPKCMVRGHVLSTFIYKGYEYDYCVRCGKICLNHHLNDFSNRESDSNHTHTMTSGMKIMTDIAR